MLVALAPDGRTALFVRFDDPSTLWSTSPAGGEPEQLTSFDEGRLVSYAWSPDGTAVALQRRPGREDNLWTLRPGSGEPKPVTEFKVGTIRSLCWAAGSQRLILTQGTASQDVVLITGGA
jgi:hypothetical protein